MFRFKIFIIILAIAILFVIVNYKLVIDDANEPIYFILESPY